MARPVEFEIEHALRKGSEDNEEYEGFHFLETGLLVLDQATGIITIHEKENGINSTPVIFFDLDGDYLLTLTRIRSSNCKHKGGRL